MAEHETEHTGTGGENVPPQEPTHDAPPHDGTAREPLGPMTPDDETPLGDTSEAHDEISPHDIPKDNPGRAEAERQAGGEDGTTRGDV